MKLTLTINEVATLQKLVYDRIQAIHEKTESEAEKRNDNQLSSLLKLGKKLKRQTEHDKNQRRRKADDKRPSCRDTGKAS